MHTFNLVIQMTFQMVKYYSFLFECINIADQVCMAHG